MSRAVDMRTVDSAGYETLRRCDDTLSATRQFLHHGRGNVAEDLAATDWRNLSRVAATDRYFERTILPESLNKASNLGEAELRARASLASTAMFVGAGNCGAHAELATHLHAASLRTTDTDRVYVQSVVHPDGSTHEWAELSSAAAGRVVMDAWSRGPAVLAEDSRLREAFVPESGGRSYSYQDAASIQQAMHDRWVTLLTRDAQTLSRGASRPISLADREFIAPTLPVPGSVLEPEFASRVRTQLRSGAQSEGPDAAGGESSQRRSLNHEILAAGVARSMGASVTRASARTVLPSIIESARRLARDGSLP